MDKIDQIKAQLDRIESRLSDPKAMATCLVCQQEKTLYAVMGWGSKYDLQIICYDCLDNMIDIRMGVQRCKKCHRPLLGSRIIAKEGVMCELCYQMKG